MQNSATLPPYRLRTERRLRLTGVSTTLCLKYSRHGVKGVLELLHHDNASANTAAVTLDFLAASDVQLATHPPYSPDLAPVTGFCSLPPKAAEGKSVSVRRRCPSIFRGRHFGHTQSTLVGCHRQLVLRGWSNVYRLTGISSKGWSRQSGCKCC